MFSQLTSGCRLNVALSSGLFNSMAFFAIWVLLWLPIAIPRAYNLQWHPPHPLTAPQKLSLLTPLYLWVPFLLWGMVRLENRPFSDYGLSLDGQIIFSLVEGIGLSIFTLFIGYGLQIVGGGLQWQRVNVESSLTGILVSILVLSLWISATEEAVFRGFLLTELDGEVGRVGAAIASSFVFALSHLIWDVKGSWRQLPGLGLMGLILVAARGVDGGSLGLAWGLHAGWIWGLLVLDTTQVLAVTSERKIPVWITGLEGQPLSGFVGLAILAITGLMLRLIR